MKKIYITRGIVFSILIGIGMVFSMETFGTAISWGAPASGDWATASNWSGGVLPGASDDVTIPSGKTVTISTTVTKINKIAVNGKLIITVDGVLNVEQTVSNTPVFDLIGGEVENAGSLTIKNTLANSNTVLKLSEHTTRDDKFTNTGILTLDNTAGTYSFSTGKCIGLSQTTSTRTMLLKLNGTLNLANIKTSSKFIEMDGAVATIDGTTTIGSDSDYKNWKFISIIGNGNLTFASTANITMYSGLVNTDGAITISNTAASGGITNNGILTIHNGSTVTGSAIFINPAVSISTAFTNNKDIAIDGLSPIAAFNIGNANAGSSVTINNASTGTFSIANTHASASAILTSITPTVQFTNDGILTLDVPASSRTMYFGDNSATFTNNGTFTINAAITGNDGTNACVINNTATGIFNANVIVDAVAVSSAKKITFNNLGLITGRGHFASGTFNTLTGTINPGIGSGTGIIRIYQNPYTFTGKCIMQIKGTGVAGTDYDQILFGFTPSGTVTIDPTARIEVTTGGGYTPSASDKVALINAYTSHNGTFTPANVIVPADWSLDYSATLNIALKYSDIPTLAATTSATSITTTSATSGGNITSNGGSAVTVSGICWNTSTAPTNALSTKTTNGATSGTYTGNITSLTANTLYYLRSYATNVAGTAYGTEISFTTLPAAPTSSAASSITASGFTANWTAPTQGAAAFTYSVDYGTVSDLSSGVTTVSGIASSNLSNVITGLSANTTYYYRVKAVNVSGAGAVSDIQSATTDLITEVSTLKNVSDLTLTSGSVLNVISGGKLTINQSTTVYSLTVEAGGKVTNTSTLNATSLTLNSNATGTATYLDNGTSNITSANVKQYLTTGRNWYVSVPITSASRTAIGASSVVCYKEPTASWVTQTVDATLNPMCGYIAVNPTTDGAVTFSGTLNNGSKSIVLTRTTGISKEGFNLVGNPYPSYVKWDAATRVNLEPTIWYRTKFANNSAYTFDTYNSDSHLGTGNNGTTVSDSIPPMQAFWVRVASGNATGSLTFDNSMRAHKGVIQNRLKAPAVANSAQQVLRLQVSNGVNSDEAIILFNSNASNGFDDYDSPKMTNANASIPEIYTLSGTEQVVINGLKSIETIPELPLGFTTGQSNSFTIKASEISNFEANTKIILKDNLLHTEQELTLGVPYEFSSSIISNADRFSLIFRVPSITTHMNTQNENTQTAIYKVDNRIVIQNTGKDAVVTICNAIGQKLVTKQLLAEKMTIENNFETGIYVVTIRSVGRTTTKKILID